MQAKQQMFERDFTTATISFSTPSPGQLHLRFNARFQHEMLTFPEIRKPGQCVTPFASHQFACLDEIILRIRAFRSKYILQLLLWVYRKTPSSENWRNLALLIGGKVLYNHIWINIARMCDALTHSHDWRQITPTVFDQSECRYFSDIMLPGIP